MVLLLDLVVVAGVMLRSPAMFESLAATWLPLALIFVASWATGSAISMMPDAKPART